MFFGHGIWSIWLFLIKYEWKQSWQKWCLHDIIVIGFSKSLIQISHSFEFISSISSSSSLSASSLIIILLFVLILSPSELGELRLLLILILVVF